MLRQTILAIVVLIILIISQVVWFNQLWKIDKRRFHNEINTELSSIINYQSLKETYPPNNSKEKNAQIKIGGKSKKTDETPFIVGEITTDRYDSEKNMAKMIENAFMDFNLDSGKIKVHFIDSVFRKSYSHINEISYYSLKLEKNNLTSDSILYGKKPLTSSFNIDIPLGSKKTHHLKAVFNLKPSAQIKNMLFSIGITAIAVILVAILILLQLLQIRKKTLQLQWREKTVSGIVHDLKSPLSYVYTMLGFFGSSEKDTSKQLSLNTAKTRVKYLSEKIELILSAVRASNSRLQMNRSSYSFNVRCQEIMDELKMIYKEKQIDFELLSSSDLILNVDNFYFEGCIRNLLDNAVKYSPQNVEISVSSELKNNRIFLYFKDNGSGVPKKMYKKVFKEFYRNTDSGNIKGHGIGLSFTRQIVEAHKGKIYIQNNNEKGTKFVIELPSLTN